ELAGGLRRNTFMRRAEILRTPRRGTSYTFNPPFPATATENVLPVDIRCLMGLLRGDPPQNLMAEAGIDEDDPDQTDHDDRGRIHSDVAPHKSINLAAIRSLPLLEPEDVLVILRNEDVQQNAKATVIGSVARPGQFDLLGGMRIS